MAGLRVSRVDALDPYDPSRPCPKCSHEGVGASYRDGGGGCEEADCSVCEPEHIRRWCRRCRYEWAEAVRG